MKDSPAMESDISALKGDLDRLDAKLGRSLALQEARLDARMEHHKEDLRKEMRELKDCVLTTSDAAAKRIEALLRDSTFMPAVLDKQGARLDDHEMRLTRLEQRP